MDKNIEDIKHIRSMMERSSKFLSLSGLSGISAGCVALVGAWVARCVMRGEVSIMGNTLYDVLLIAVIVVIVAALSGLYFCVRKARKNNMKLWTPITYLVLGDFLVPMIVGGLFCFILLYQGQVYLTVSAMLIFYGLALITASARTYKNIRILGASEIILGLITGFFVQAYSEYTVILIDAGIIFWAIGFGVLHIVYGIVMYYKYDVKSAKEN